MIINGAAFQCCSTACWVGGEAPHSSLLTSAFIWLAPLEDQSGESLLTRSRRREREGNDEGSTGNKCSCDGKIIDCL